jgi:hypothetical protein
MRLVALATVCSVAIALAAAPSLFAGSTARNVSPCQTTGWKIVLKRFTTQPAAARLYRRASHYGFKNATIVHVDNGIWQVELVGYPSRASVTDSMREVRREPDLRALRPHTVHL